MDFFHDIEEIRDSFHRFAALLPQNGLLVIHKSISRLDEFLDGLHCSVVTFGLEPDADYAAANVTYDDEVHASYDLYIKGKFADHITLSVPGAHNVTNSLAVIAVALSMDIPLGTIRAGLQAFGGAHRRFDKKGTVGGITIIDDYAHHPTEIATTLSTAQKYPHNRLFVVFQPHTYTRTKAFLKDFAKALSLADEVVLADIYAAREKNTVGISSRDLEREIAALGTNVHYFPSFDEIETFLLENCMHGDLLITMGAGDILLVGDHLLGK